MTGFTTALRIVLAVLAACFVLWVTATVRENTRMERDLENLDAAYRQVLGNAQRLAKASGHKDARERVIYKRFVEYRERASEAVDVECDPRALDERYVEQLRLAEAAAVRLPDAPTRVAGPDGDLGTVTVHAR
jgi:hypothetical protein